MKKTLRALAMASAALCAVPLTHASGIPTVDAANLAQMILDAQAQAQQALDALNTAKDGIAQAKAQYEHYKGIVTGNDKLGGFLNDPALNQLLPIGDWADLYENTKDLGRLREKYGLQSENPQVQEKFDELLAVTGALEANYDASTKRVTNAEKLRQMLDEVQTPQQKEDLNLRFQQEFLEVQNQQLRLDNMKYLAEQKTVMQDHKARAEFLQSMSKRRSLDDN